MTEKQKKEYEEYIKRYLEKMAHWNNCQEKALKATKEG